MAKNDGYPPKVTFDAQEEDALEAVRRVFWNRLGADSNFRQLQGQDPIFNKYVDYARPRDEADFQRFLVDVFWELVNQGVICPGTENGNPSPPFFHLTEYGKGVLGDSGYDPHDAKRYLDQLGISITNPDATILAYLRESLFCFSHGTMVASAMMLGIAAERAFILVCDSVVNSLNDPNEESDFKKLLKRNAMKPKLDWLANKFQQLQPPHRPAGWPDDADLQLTGIYNLIRCQRNDVGHPPPTPPSISRDVAYGYLRIFPSYYSTAEVIRDFLKTNKI